MCTTTTWICILHRWSVKTLKSTYTWIFDSRYFVGCRHNTRIMAESILYSVMSFYSTLLHNYASVVFNHRTLLRTSLSLSLLFRLLSRCLICTWINNPNLSGPGHNPPSHCNLFHQCLNLFHFNSHLCNPLLLWLSFLDFLDKKALILVHIDRI